MKRQHDCDAVTISACRCWRSCVCGWTGCRKLNSGLKVGRDQITKSERKDKKWWITPRREGGPLRTLLHLTRFHARRVQLTRKWEPQIKKSMFTAGGRWAHSSISFKANRRASASVEGDRRHQSRTCQWIPMDTSTTSRWRNVQIRIGVRQASGVSGWAEQTKLVWWSEDEEWAEDWREVGWRCASWRGLLLPWWTSS